MTTATNTMTNNDNPITPKILGLVLDAAKQIHDNPGTEIARINEAVIFATIEACREMGCRPSDADRLREVAYERIIAAPTL